MEWIDKLLQSISPGATHYFYFVVVVLFLGGLLFSHVWFINGVRRDLNESRRDIRRLKLKTARLSKAVRDAISGYKRTEALVMNLDKVVQQLLDAVLDQKTSGATHEP